MTMTTVGAERPAARLADMGRQEAEEVTLVIKENFDSLGSMLVQARDRKAYKALGYRTFECYCQSEFGKSISSAYQLIEDAKVLAQLEAKISKNYGEEVTLKFPASHLRPLKAIEDIDDKLKAIEYAQKLAASEGKKATKRHLELAVFEVSGKRSEDYKKAIESLGFKKGVTVELKQTLRGGDRGIVTNVDKRGQISVVLFTSGAVPVVCDASELRILEESEKPARPLADTTASKGDRVRIFTKGLEGKQGEIYTYKTGKQAAVLLDGETAPISIPYAELEIAKTNKIEPSSDWNTELVWESGKNTYYYFPQEDTIYSNKWPQGLSLKPFSHENSPIEFIKNWEDKFAGDLLECLITPARAKTLALAQAIELPEEDGKEFVADLIASLSQLFPQTSKPPRAMGISFSRTINELISGKKSQTRRAWQDDYAKNFIRYFDENIAIPALDKGRHRGSHELGFIKLTQRPYQQYLSEMSPTDLQQEGGMVATVQEFIETFFEGQDKLVWVLHFEFLTAPVNSNAEALIAENQRLQEQLAEAEACIQAIVSAASSTSPLESPKNTEFLPENNAQTSNTESSLELPPGMEPQVGLLVCIYGREDGNTYEIHKIGATEIECRNIENGVTKWIDKRILRVVVDQPMVTEILTALHSESSLETSTASDVETATADSVEAARQLDITNRTQKLHQELQVTEDELKRATTIPNKTKLRKTIINLHKSIEELRIFATLRLNQTVWHFRDKYPGEIFEFWISPGGMTHAGVNWRIDDRTSKLHEPMYVISTETPVGLVDDQSEIE